MKGEDLDAYVRVRFASGEEIITTFRTAFAKIGRIGLPFFEEKWKKAIITEINLDALGNKIDNKQLLEDERNHAARFSRLSRRKSRNEGGEGATRVSRGRPKSRNISKADNAES